MVELGVGKNMVRSIRFWAEELAALAKVNPGSLNTWLYTAGKKISGLKKLAPGLFAYQA
jgi:hypothetical protein